jgi:hypothetical protein
VDEAESRMIEAVKNWDDPDKLRTVMKNAHDRGSHSLYDAAFVRLCAIQPSSKVGTVEHDVWQSIYALEEMLRIERGKTVRLSRTRQKIARDGEVKTAADLTLKAEPSPGFHLLVERGHPELLFESVVLRHKDSFTDQVYEAALARLDAAGINLKSLVSGTG